MKRLFRGIKKLRKFLNDNKVFYEIFFIGILTLLSLNISVKSNKIAEYQSMLAQRGYSAIFRFSNKDYAYTPKIPGEVVTSTITVTVYNDGAAITNFSSTPQVFFEVKYKKKDSKDYHTLLIPVDGYYLGYTRYTGNPSGELSEHVHLDKEIRINRMLTNRFEELGWQNNLDVKISSKTYLLISYVDFLNKNQEELYFVNSPSGGTKVGVDEKNRLNNEFRKNIRIDLAKAYQYPEYIYDTFLKLTGITDSKFIQKENLNDLKPIPSGYPEGCDKEYLKKLQSCQQNCFFTNNRAQYQCTSVDPVDYYQCLKDADKSWLPCMNSCFDKYPNAWDGCTLP